MNDQMNTNAATRSGDNLDRLDTLSIEWQAREMRAEFLSEALRAAFRRIAGRGRDLRGTGTGAAQGV